MSNKKQRKVLVQFMSPHQHMEQVEVTTFVRELSPGSFVGPLPTINGEATQRLRELFPDGVGPWRDPVDTCEPFNHLVAYSDPIAGPRIAMVQQAELVVAEARW